MKYRSAQCTLDSVIRQIELANNSDYNLDTSIDTLIATKYANYIGRIHELIYDQSEQLYNVVHRTGIPYQDTYTRKGAAWKADYQRDRQRGVHRMMSPDDLLSITSYTWSGTALDTSYYEPYLPANQYPAQGVDIYDGVSFTPPVDYTESVVLVGIFGFHRNPSTMWLNSSDTVTNALGINSSVTSITVADADGTNPNSGIKRFETLQYIKIDSEFMLITGINTSTNVLTVRRGVNGTTAASHSNGAAIYTFVPDDVFESAVRRRVVFLYNNPAETRRIVPLPDGTLQLDDETRIPLPPKRYVFLSA